MAVRPKRTIVIACLAILLIIGVSCGYLFVGRVITYGAGLVLADPLPDLTSVPTQTTKIYDSGGGLLYEIGTVHRTSVQLKDVPVPVRDAFLAAEDKTFYTNPGFSITSIVRALHVDLQSDQLLQGGSTITQQLAQMTVVSKESSLTRKVREIAVSIALTHKYSKDEILERYLNEVPVGGELVGIGTAAQVYFGTTVDKLTVAQGAYIAAMINAPTILDPYANPAGLTDRQQLVLDRMHTFGFLNTTDWSRAKAETVTFLPRQNTIKYPFFSLYVRQLLIDTYGQQAINDGLTVKTSLDPILEEAAEKILKAQVAKNATNWQADNASLISANPQTGQIVAYVGGADFAVSQVDINTSDRQPGSTIKPLIYYTAFTQGYTPDTMALDAIEDFGGGYRPTDYGGGASGKYVSLRTALAASLNIPSVRVLRGVGIPAATANLSLMGFPVVSGYHYTLPLGLGAVEVSPLDMTQAYATLANGGKQIKVSPLLKVTDREGDILLDRTHRTATKQILDPVAVAAVTSITSDYSLKRQIYGGVEYQDYTMADRPAAAKTGTSSGPKDNWTIGYTPQLLTTVWTGNTSGQDLKPTADGISTAAPIWHDFMTAALAGQPAINFDPYPKTAPDADHKYIDKAPRTISSPSVTPTLAPVATPTAP